MTGAALLRGFGGAARMTFSAVAAGQLLHMVELTREAADAEGQRAQLDDQVVQFAAAAGSALTTSQPGQSALAS